MCLACRPEESNGMALQFRAIMQTYKRLVERRSKCTLVISTLEALTLPHYHYEDLERIPHELRQH